MHNRYTGLSGADSGLTALGWQQTNALATWLQAHYNCDMLVSAPNLRNRLTAQRIGQAVGKPVTVHKGLPFSAVSDLNVLPHSKAIDSILERLPETREVVDADHQPFQQLCYELNDVLRQLQRDYYGQTIAIFMGPDSIAATLMCLFDAYGLHVAVAHTSITELQLQNEQWCITCVNRCEHLPRTADERTAAPEKTTTQVEPPEDMKPILATYNQQVASATSLEVSDQRQRIADLLRFAQLKPERTVLDVGSGTGLLSLMVAEAGAKEVVGVDISPAMLERAEFLRLSYVPELARRVDFRLAAVQALPFRNERFDTAFCRMILHLSRKPDAILREVRRVLRPAGTLMVADLLSADDSVKRATHNAIEAKRNPAHVAARSAQQYRELVLAAGFEIVDEETVTFERSLDEWLQELTNDSASDAVVREMVEASLETDAAGIDVRRSGDDLHFAQRLFYLKALKT